MDFLVHIVIRLPDSMEADTLTRFREGGSREGSGVGRLRRATAALARARALGELGSVGRA